MILLKLKIQGNYLKIQKTFQTEECDKVNNLHLRFKGGIQRHDFMFGYRKMFKLYY